MTVVDVRQPYEYDGTLGAPCDPRQGHIPGAIHLNVDDLAALTRRGRRASGSGVAPGEEIVVYCHSGSRSARAAQILRQLGFEARNYVGSWHEWSRTDLPLET